MKSINFPAQTYLDRTICTCSTTCTCRTISPKLQALADAFPGHIKLTPDPLVIDFNLDLYALHNDLPAAEVYARAFLEFYTNNPKKGGARPCIIAQTRQASPDHDGLVWMLDSLAREPQYSDYVFWIFGKPYMSSNRLSVEGKVLQLYVLERGGAPIDAVVSTIKAARTFRPALKPYIPGQH